MVAKFFHLYSAVIQDVEVDDPEELMELLTVLSRMVRMLEGILPNENAHQVRPLSGDAQRLATEACRLLHVSVRRAFELGDYHKFCHSKHAQKIEREMKQRIMVGKDFADLEQKLKLWAYLLPGGDDPNHNPALVRHRVCQAVVRHVSPPKLVHLLTRVVLYGLALDAGLGHGQFINERFVRNAAGRDELRFDAVAAMTRTLAVQPAWKYDVLLQFSREQVFQKRPLRASFHQELLDLIQQEVSILALMELVRASHDDLVIECMYVDVLRSRSIRSPKRVLMAVTRKHLLLYEIPPKATDVQNQWLQWPEKACPEENGPKLLWERELHLMTRLQQGFGPQLFSIYWDHHVAPNGDQIEDVEHYSCVAHGGRHTLIDALYIRSGPLPEVRVDLELDWVFQGILTQKAHSDEVVALTYAKAKTAMRPAYHPLVCILTESDVYLFEVDWSHWHCLPHMPADGRSAVASKRSQGWKAHCDDGIGFSLEASDAVLEHGRQEHKLPTAVDQAFGLDEEDRKRAREWLVKGRDRLERRDNVIDASKRYICGGAKRDDLAKLSRICKPLFQSVDNFPLSKLSKVTFEAEEVAELELQFGARALTILFDDDLAREHWRRCLAYAVNKSDTASQWKRAWDE